MIYFCYNVYSKIYSEGASMRLRRNFRRLLTMAEKMILGAQMYTVRDFTQTPDDFARTMERLAKIGYRYVQVSGIGEAVKAADIAKAAKDSGLSVVLTHTAVSRIVNETEKVIEEHELFNCDGIGLGGAFAYMPFDDEKTAKFVEDFRAASEKIKAAGKRFLYHNHKFEFERLPGGKLILDNILDLVPDMMLTLDMYWVQAGGGDPAQAIRKYKDRIYATHFKDMAIVGDKQVYYAVGEGNMNYDAIVRACVECGVTRHFVEQDTVPEGADPFDCLETSYKNIMSAYGQYFN